MLSSLITYNSKECILPPVQLQLPAQPDLVQCATELQCAAADDPLLTTFPTNDVFKVALLLYYNTQPNVKQQLPYCTT